MKKTLWTLSALALAGMFFTACEDPDDEVTAESCAAKNMDLGKDADGKAICVARQASGDCASDDACKTADANKPFCVSVPSGKKVCSGKKECDQGQTRLESGLCGSAEVRKSCNLNSECEADMVCNKSNECEDKNSAGKVYRYVRIDDLSTPTTTQEDPGADIDAIVLYKPATGKTFYAGAVTGFNFPETYFKNDGDKANDPKKILNEPDAFTTYTNAGLGANEGKCNYRENGDLSKDFTFVSLGGVGGFIEVEMKGAIENGDKLDILELGGCQTQGTKDDKTGQPKVYDAKSENIKVQISLTDKATVWDAVTEFDRTKTNDKGLLSWTVTGLK